MEAKLRAMESRLRLDDVGGAPGSAAPPPPPAASDPDTVGFSFKEGMPSAADFSKSLPLQVAQEEAVAVNGVNGVNGRH